MRLYSVFALIALLISCATCNPGSQRIYTNANCAGDHVGYIYTLNGPDVCSGECTNVSGGYWSKEECNANQPIPTSVGLVTVTQYSDAACTTVKAYAGGLPDRCIILSNTDGITAMRFTGCTNDVFSFVTSYTDETCTSFSGGNTTVSSTCTANPKKANDYYKTGQCVPSPPQAPQAPVAAPTKASSSAASIVASLGLIIVAIVV